MGVYFRRVQIFLPSGFFSRAGGGDIAKIKPKLGVQNDKNQGKKTINAPVVATKKATGRKNLHSAEMTPPGHQLTKIRKNWTMSDFSRSI